MSKNTQDAILIRDSAITLSARALVFLMGLAMSVVVSRVLGPTLKGSFSIILLIISVTSLLVMFGLGSANVYFGARDPDELPTLAGNSLVAAFALGLLGIAVVQLATLLPAFQGYLTENGVDVAWVRALILLLPLVQLNLYLVEIVRARGDIVRYNLVALWGTSVSLVAVVVLVWFLAQGVSGAVNAWVISLVAVSALTVWLALRAAGGPLRIGWDSLRRNFAFGVRLHPGNIAQFLNYRVDVFLVAFFLAPAQVGLYVTAAAIAERLWEIPHAIRTVLLYHAATGDANAANAATGRVSRVVVVLIGAMCLLMAVTSYPLVLLLYGTAYLPAAPALIALMPGIWAMSLCKLLTVHLTARGRPEVGTFAAVISLGATLVLDVLLIPKIGIVGAALASSASYVLATFVVVAVFLDDTGLRFSEIAVIRREDLLMLRQVLCGALRERFANQVG